VLERLNHVLRAHRRNGGLPEAVLELQARIAEEFDPEFLLIDSRTGITELGGLATSLLADRVVCLTTTSPESVEGIRVVAEALRVAPRLASQKPLQLDVLVTRVEGRLTRVLNVLDDLDCGRVTLLRHDSGIASAEQVWQRSQPPRSIGIEDPGMILFEDTLSWIGMSFPGHEHQVERARRRMRAVYWTWQYLTRGPGPHLGLFPDRVNWSPNQLRERFRLGGVDNSRQADIVADDLTGKPIMVLEYVDSDEDPEAAARWWLSETEVPVVTVLGDDPSPRLYSRRGVPDSNVRLSARRDLPLPRDFDALPDPTDVSVEALLDAARRGYPDYIRRIVDEWLMGNEDADEIVGGLARLDNIELARQALEYSAFGVVGQGVNGLFPQLFWRLPPEASVQVAQQLGHCGTAVAGTLALLAQETLGLHYQPGAMVAVGAEVQDPSTRSISFEISTASPEIAVASGGMLGEYRPGTNEVVLYSEAIAQRAGQLALRARHVGSVTLIHETLRALAHVGRDLDGRNWPESGLPFKSALLFEALIQYFTHRHIVRLRDPELLRTWETMTGKQTPDHRTWKPIRDLSAEDARSLFMGLRRGAELAPEWQAWYDALPHGA
jgi:hypothetical protein